MATLTTPGGLPYPDGNEKVRDGDNAIGALATKVDTNAYTYVVTHSEAGMTSAATGNLWLTNLVQDIKQGNITFAATGITIAVAGVYEIVHRARFGTAVGFSQLSIGLSTTIIATSFLQSYAAGNATAVVQYIGQFAVGNVIQFGWNQPGASAWSYAGSSANNIQTVRLIRAT